MRPVAVVSDTSRPVTHASAPEGVTTGGSSNWLFCFPHGVRTPSDSKGLKCGRVGGKHDTVCNRGSVMEIGRHEAGQSGVVLGVLQASRNTTCSSRYSVWVAPTTVSITEPRTRGQFPNNPCDWSKRQVEGHSVSWHDVALRSGEPSPSTPCLWGRGVFG